MFAGATFASRASTSWTTSSSGTSYVVVESHSKTPETSASACKPASWPLLNLKPQTPSAPTPPPRRMTTRPDPSDRHCLLVSVVESPRIEKKTALSPLVSVSDSKVHASANGPECDGGVGATGLCKPEEVGVGEDAGADAPMATDATLLESGPSSLIQRLPSGPTAIPSPSS